MLLRWALLFSIASAVLHVIALAASGQDAMADPVSALSQGTWGGLHTFSLVLFGGAQVMLAVALGDLGRGFLWPYGRGLVAAAGIVVLAIAWYFTAAPAAALQGPHANDPLWVAATLVGIAMGCLHPGLSRLSSGLGRYNLGCLVAWVVLIPAILLVDSNTLGGYERSVGAVYVAWVSGVCAGALWHRSTSM